MEGLIDTDFGKHDYDWLLTPPETPFVRSSKASDHQIPSQKPKTKPTRSVSTTRASRVRSSQSEVTSCTKVIRSSSLTRPSVLKSHNFLPTNNKNNSPSEKLHTCISSLTSRSSTPAKTFRTIDPPRDQNPMKARPTSKPHNANSNSKSNSRSSTPSRRPPPTNRPTSTGRSALAPVHPIEILELPSEAPKNPRSSSAGRLHSVKGSVGWAALNPQNAVSGLVCSKFIENLPQGKSQKSIVESGARKINKASTGFGRNISKNSVDMAFRHMDMKQSISVIRNTTIIPPSIRSSTKQTHASVKENSKYNVICLSNLGAARKNGSDTHASGHCDAMLSKEDKNSLNWLHSAEDKSDQSVLFDHGDSLPEPFAISDK